MRPLAADKARLPFYADKKPVFLILAALCLLVYANILDNAFVSDDIPAILQNQAILQLHRFWFAPASFLDALSLRILGYNPFLYHLVSLILHSLNTILVFLFLRLIFEALPSFLGACLFAVHPIHTEAVAWISGKPYLLLALFTLGCYLLYCRAVNPPSKDGNFNPGWYCLSLFCFSYFIISSYGFFSLFPLFLILSDVTFGHWKKNWRWWLPFIIIVIVRLTLARGAVVERIVLMEKARGLASGASLFSPLVSFYWHLWLMLWPGKLALYHLEDAPEALYVYSPLLLFAVALFLYLAFRKAKELFFALGMFLIFLAPTYSFVPISSLVGERYIYLPSIALSVLIAYSYEKFPYRKLKKYLLILLMVIISACAVRTVLRNQDWENPLRFWKSNVRAYPGSVKARNNLAIAYSNAGNYDMAVEEYNKALELDPLRSKTYNNRGAILLLKGRFSEALSDFNRALELDSGYAKAYNNRGSLYLAQGRFSEALSDFNRALELDPHYGKAYLNRASVYLERAEYAKGRRDLLRAEELGCQIREEIRNGMLGGD